jgi:hypothetical protein
MNPANWPPGNRRRSGHIDFLIAWGEDGVYAIGPKWRRCDDKGEETKPGTSVDIASQGLGRFPAEFPDRA